MLGIGLFLPVILVEVIQEFNLDAGLAGLLATLNGLGLGIMSFYAGFLIDKLGYLYGLWVGMIITGLTNIIIFQSSTATELFLAVVAAGIGSSFMTAASYPLIAIFWEES